MDIVRILALSDSHGSLSAVREALERQPGARAVFFLGDGLREMREAADRLCVKEPRFVCGNNDWGAGDVPFSGLDIVAGRRVFYTHGHRYEVKMGLQRAMCAAYEREADLLLFGHTHQPITDYVEGPGGRPLYILNPGSLRYGRTYGVIDFTPGGIVPRIVALDGRRSQ